MFFVRIIFRWLWLVLLIAALVIAGGLCWFNSYLYSPTSLEAVRYYLSEKSGLPWAFSRAGGNILEGLRLHDVGIDNPGSPPPGRLFRIPVLLFKFNFWTLPLGRIDLTDVKIGAPELSLQIGPNQEVLWPSATAFHSGPGKAVPDQQFLTWLNQASLSEQRVRMEDAGITLKTPDLAEALSLSGIAANFFVREFPSGLTAGGQASIKEWRVGAWEISDWESHLVYEQGTLKFPDFTAHAYHGTLLGSYEQKITDGQLPYSWKISASKLELNEIFSSLFNKSDVVTGQLSGETTWQGALSNPLEATGSGSLTLDDGQLIQSSFFQQLAKNLGVPDLGQPDYSKCRLDFSLENKVFTISSLEIDSILFDFHAQGTIRFDGVMDLACELRAKPDLVKLLSQTVVSRFPTNTDGQLVLKFQLQGTFDQPVTNLWQLMTPPAPPLPDPAPVAPVVPLPSTSSGMSPS